jgi:hypothetical protein
MSQLSLFSPADLAKMRDRTKARNYSPERAAFRRDHQRRRDHGKAQRHAERIYRDFQQSCDNEFPRIPARSPAPSKPQEQYVDRST